MSARWVEVGDRVFARRYAFLDQTIGAVIGAEGAVLVDTRSTPSHAAELLADLGTLTRAPLRFVANTHGHWDHVFGNAAVRPAPIWGHVRCADMVRRTGEAQRAGVVERYVEIADEVRQVEIVSPDRTFEDAAVLDLGDRQVELRHLGRGHTDGDVVVRVVDASVLFAGDLLENGAPPFFGDGFPLDWADTGRRLLDLVDGAVVPGHGEVSDRHFAERQVAELGALAELCRASATGQLGLDELIRRSPFPPDTTREALERAMLELGAQTTQQTE